MRVLSKEEDGKGACQEDKSVNDCKTIFLHWLLGGGGGVKV